MTLSAQRRLTQATRFLIPSMALVLLMVLMSVLGRQDAAIPMGEGQATGPSTPVTVVDFFAEPPMASTASLGSSDFAATVLTNIETPAPALDRAQTPGCEGRGGLPAADPNLSHVVYQWDVPPPTVSRSDTILHAPGQPAVSLSRSASVAPLTPQDLGISRT